LGVSLSSINDYAFIILSNAAPTPGPDSQGVLTAAGNFTGVPQLTFEKVISPFDFQAASAAQGNNALLFGFGGNWTSMLGVVPRNTGTTLSGATVTLTAGSSIDFTLPQIQGFYAVRARLSVAPTPGTSVLVTGNTFPVLNATSNPAEIAALQQLTTQLLAFNLWASDQANTDYLAGATGASYP
jgi:hypothetical protein